MELGSSCSASDRSNHQIMFPCAIPSQAICQSFSYKFVTHEPFSYKFLSFIECPTIKAATMGAESAAIKKLVAKKG